MKKLAILISLVMMFSVVYSQMEEVAVVAINVNKHIEAGDFGSVAGLSALSKDPNFDLTSVVEKFRTTLFDDFSEDFTFDLLDEKSVTENEDYKAYALTVSNGMTDFFYISPKGYEFIAPDKKSKEKMMELFGDQVQGVMFAQVGYSLEKKVELAGFGVAYVQSWVLIQVFDKEGKKIFNLRCTAKSTNTFKFAMGGNVLEAKEIIPLCEEATDNAFLVMKKKLPKSIKKMDKKLAKE